MGSPARRRRDRVARRRRHEQLKCSRERREDERRCCWGTQIVADFNTPKNLKDVTPQHLKMIGGE